MTWLRQASEEAKWDRDRHSFSEVWEVWYLNSWKHLLNTHHRLLPYLPAIKFKLSDYSQWPQQKKWVQTHLPALPPAERVYFFRQLRSAFPCLCWDWPGLYPISLILPLWHDDHSDTQLDWSNPLIHRKKQQLYSSQPGIHRHLNTNAAPLILWQHPEWERNHFQFNSLVPELNINQHFEWRYTVNKSIPTTWQNGSLVAW